MVCHDFSNFFDYFEQNMNALYLPAPNELFGTVATAYANIDILASAVSLYGHQVTVAEAFGAATRLEKYKLIGTLGAAYYTGASVGSAAVALGRVLGCGSTIADAMWHLRENGIFASWVEGELLATPEFLQRR